jgi:hypothetical protein
MPRVRNVLILGGRAPVALDHARRFAHQGWDVHVADSVSFRLSSASRAVAGAVLLPSPRHRGVEFCRALNSYVKSAGIDLVVPTCEEVFFLARYRKQLPSELVVAVDEFDKLSRLHSKIVFLDEARACSVDTPASQAVSSLEEAREWANGRACVIKPEFSRFGVFVRLYPLGVPQDAAPLAALGRWVVQDYCTGTELCSYSIASRGELLAHQTYRPSYRLGRSSSYYFDPAHEPRIEHSVRTLVAKTSFTGQISFDWMRDRGGRCFVLECNPRATSGLHLFEASDAIPEALMGSRAAVAGSPRQPRMIAAIMATTGVWQSLRRGTLSTWRQDFARARDVLSAPGDRRPIAGSLLDIASYARLAMRERCSLREAATQDIEWDGQPI